jgi:hypothetical protein
VLLLSVDQDVRYRPGWGTGLCWATKVTPLVARAVLDMDRVLEGWPLLVLVGAAATLFAVVAGSDQTFPNRRAHAFQANCPGPMRRHLLPITFQTFSSLRWLREHHAEYFIVGSSQ